MAVRIDATTEWITRSTSLPAANAFTACGWARNLATLTGDRCLCIFGNTDLTENHGYGNLNGIGWCVFNSTDTPPVFDSSPAANEIFFWALRADGTDLAGYFAKVGDATLNKKTTAYRTFTPGLLRVGNDILSDYANMTIGPVKIWDAALTDAEIAQERWGIRPRRTTNIHIWSPLQVNSIDYSGQGRNWTESGTPTYEDGPPVGWGAPPQFVIGQPAAATISWFPQGSSSGMLPPLVIEG